MCQMIKNKKNFDILYNLIILFIWNKMYLDRSNLFLSIWLIKNK